MNVRRIVGAPNVLEAPGEAIIASGTIGTSVVGQVGWSDLDPGGAVRVQRSFAIDRRGVRSW